MSNVKALFRAIVEENRTAMNGLLQAEPTLANAAHGGKQEYDQAAHWIMEGDTPLHMACAVRFGYAVRALLKAGAVADGRTRSGVTPMHYVADGLCRQPSYRGDEAKQIIRLLIDHGAEVDQATKNKVTPLHRAVRSRSAAAVEALLDAGANPKAKNNSGSTPFHLAVQSTGRPGVGSDDAIEQQKQIITMFLNRGVSPKLKDNKGRTVTDAAGSKVAKEMLKSARPQVGSVGK